MEIFAFLMETTILISLSLIFDFCIILFFCFILNKDFKLFYLFDLVPEPATPLRDKLQKNKLCAKKNFLVWFRMLFYVFILFAKGKDNAMTRLGVI